ncbi:MAG: precorrin-3B C(17)-methyltransferase [Chloroflexi bacterium]|nr:precorrin-3B C(17)-methyltransferase [Chloroflexota bacterium]
MNGRRRRSGVAVVAVTRQGTRLGAQIVATLRSSLDEDSDVEIALHIKSQWAGDAPEDAVPFDGSLGPLLADLFPQVETLISVLAVGATVRLVAPLLGKKRDDPGVICVDDAGQFVIPVLGGHQTDANGLAQEIADAIGATAVVTTASDAIGLPNLDRLGSVQQWRMDALPETVKQVSAAALAGQLPTVYFPREFQGPHAELPEAWPRADSLAALRGVSGPRIAITDRVLPDDLVSDGGPLLVYRPRTLVLGIGCSTDATPDDVESLARRTLSAAGLAWGSVHTVATIDRRLDHPALVRLVWQADAAYFPVFTPEQLAAVPDVPTPSAEVERHVGTPGVAEPAAILASQGGVLLVPKQKSATATVAVARRGSIALEPGALWLVGIGPGPLDLIAPRASRAIRSADIVIGYRGYLELLSEIVSESRMRPYDLGQEHERAAAAIRLAQQGRQVAVVSSGDIGVYGMAGLVFELLHEQPPSPAGEDISVEVIPGITAASSANALLGAPLMLDFAAISLSDLLVPWDGIRRRLEAAAQGDLVVVLYNPASARRRQPFEDAVAILREHRAPETPVGLVRDAYRDEENVTVTTLAELTVDDVDMRTVVVVGCSRTELLDGVMVTRRGYLERPGR